LKNVILDKIEFKYKLFSDFLEELKKVIIYFDDKGKMDKYEKELNCNNLILSFGLGGLHSIDTPKKILPLENQLLEDRDCASMHPKCILNYGFYPEHLGEA
jgi:hypothetical protein